MTAQDQTAFLKTNTPANACTVSDRALRDAFRASMDAPVEKAGFMDHLTARIAALKPAPKTAKSVTPEAAPEAVVDTPAEAISDLTPKTPQDEEGSLFAHLNEIMQDNAEPEVEPATDPEKPQSKSVIVRAVSALLPKKKAKPAAKAKAPVAAPKPATEKQSGSIIVALVRRLIPAKTEKPAAKPAPAKQQSGSVIVAILKAISPIKKSA